LGAGGAGRSRRSPEILRHLGWMTDYLLAPLRRQLGDRNAQNLPVTDGIEAEIRLLDRFLDGGERGLVEGLDDEQPRLGRRERGELDERRLGAVVLGLDAFQERRRRAARARPRQLAAKRRDGLLHLLLQVVENFLVRHAG